MRMWKLGAYVLALMAVACGGSTQLDEVPEAGGVLQLPLKTKGADGQTYTLMDAAFEISGPQNVTLNNTTEDTLSVPLRQGLYSVRLTGPWRLVNANRPAETLQVELVSPNPLPFSIQESEVSQVRFLFKLPGQGSADVGFQVDSGGTISGNIVFDQVGSSPGDGPLFDGLSGQTVPVLLNFESSTITRATEGSMKRLHVVTSPVTLQFGGTPHEALVSRVAPALKGVPAEFDLVADSTGRVRFMGIRLGWDAQNRPTRAFTLLLQEQSLMQSVLDSEGYPAVQPFQVDTTLSIGKAQSSSSAAGRGSFLITPR